MPDDVDPPPGTPPATTLEEIPPPERTPVAGVQRGPAAAVGPSGRTGLRRSALGRGQPLRRGGRGPGGEPARPRRSQAFAHSGLSLLWTGTWDPTHKIYGAETFIVGTLVTTAVALVLAVPIGVATAAFLSELAPRWLAAPLSVLIDLIAAVPEHRGGSVGSARAHPRLRPPRGAVSEEDPGPRMVLPRPRPRSEHAPGRGGPGRDDPAHHGGSVADGPGRGGGDRPGGGPGARAGRGGRSSAGR